MKKTILAVMLALALVLIPMSAALAQDATVTVNATPTVVSLNVSPLTWDINDISGSGSIWPATTYYAHAGTTWTDDRDGPSNPVVDDDCRFTFDNNGSVPIAITCDMTSFSNGDANMTNSELGYDGAVGADEFGASAYASGDAWDADAVILKLSGSDLFIESLGEDGGGSDTIKWGVGLLTQTNAFGGTNPSDATIDCTASEP
jgi:hypothetical protein